MKQPVSYKGMMPMVSGDYTVRVILRNRACPSRDETDCVRAYSLLEGAVRIPDWSEDRAVLGDVVLGYGVESRPGEPVYRAYRFGNSQLNPNPSGVYAIGSTIVAGVGYVNAPEGAQLRLRVLPQAPAGAEQAQGDVTPVIDQTAPVTDAGPVIQELSLADFEGGMYRLEANLVDPDGRNLDTRSVPLTVSPRTSIVRASVQGSVPQIRPEIPGIVEMALGEQYLGIEEKVRGRAMLEQALEANPSLGPARELLAGIELEEGNTARVVELLEPVYAHVQDRFGILSLLGNAYAKEGDYAKAVEVLEKAVELERPRPPLLNVLADAQYRTGNPARALELLERSLELDPGQPAVEELVTKLKAELD